MHLTINKNFQNLIPPLTEEEYNQLEKNIIRDGCINLLVVWKGTIVDGHNRYKICQENDIKFKVKEMEFEDDNEAKIWIGENQFARRNLNAFQRAEIAIKLKPLYAKRGKERQGERTDLLPTLAKGSHNTRNKISQKAKVSHGTLDKVELIIKDATVEEKEQLRSGEESVNKVFGNIKKRERRERNEIPEPELPDGKYKIFYADPPWNYGNSGLDQYGHAERHYSTMPTKDICELKINEMTNKDAVLFLWVTSPLLEDAFKVINAWGFKYKTSFVWDKIGHNFGYYNSVRHEFLLIATKGSCLPDNRKLHDSVVSIEKSSKHSEKPEKFRQIIDDIYRKGKRIELFARKKVHKNWDVWGNDIKLTKENK